MTALVRPKHFMLGKGVAIRNAGVKYSVPTTPNQKLETLLAALANPCCVSEGVAIPLHRPGLEIIPCTRNGERYRPRAVL